MTERKNLGVKGLRDGNLLCPGRLRGGFACFFFPSAVASSHPWRGGFRFSDRIKQVCVTCVRTCARWRIKINLSPILSSLFIPYVDIILRSACSYLIFLFYFFSFIQRPFSLFFIDEL